MSALVVLAVICVFGLIAITHADIVLAVFTSATRVIHAFPTAILAAVHSENSLLKVFASSPIALSAIATGFNLRAVRREDVDALIAENEHFIDQVTHTIPDILFVYDFDERRVIYLNNSASTVLGYSAGEFQTMGQALIQNLVHPVDYERLPDWFERVNALKKGEVLEHEYRLRHKSGEWRWVRSRVVSFKRTRSDRVKQVLAVAHDITDRKAIEEALIESEARNASILRALPDLMFVQHRDGTYLDYYARDPSQLLVPPEVFLGRNMREILPDDVLIPISENFERAIFTGEPQRLEYRLDIGGTESHFECRIVPGGRDKVLSIVRNISEEKRTAAALTESEARFKAQYRGIPVPTYTWQKAGNDFILGDLNDEAVCANNAELERLLNTNASKLFWNSPQIVRSLRRCFREKTIIEEKLAHDLFDPQVERSLNVRYVPVPPDMVMVHAEDVTERERTLRSLHDKIEELQAAREEIAEKGAWLEISRSTIEEERRRYWELFEFAPVGYITTDISGVVLEVNQAAATLLRTHRDLIKGTPIIGFATQKDLRVLTNFVNGLVHGEGASEIELCLRRNDEEFDASIKAIRLDSKGVAELWWMIQDITESNRTKEELEQSERFSRSIIASSNDCIKILDLEGNLLYINPRGLQLLDMQDDACIGSEWLKFWEEMDQAAIRPELDKARAGDEGRFQGKCKTGKGVVKWFDVVITPISDSHGRVKRLLVVSRDITEQKIVEEKLHEKERFFRSLVENAHEIVTVLNLDGTIVYESPSCERILGYSFGERIGKPCFDYVHPDDLARVKKLFTQMIGRGITVEAIEYRYKHKSGDYITLEVVARLSFDESGYPIVIVNKRDITERKQREEQVHELSVRLLNLQDDERRHLARELHDETAQNLAVIDMNISLMKESLGPGDEKAISLLQQIETLNKRSLQEVRTVSYLLHPPMLDEAGLVSALRWMIGGFSDRSGIKVDFIQNADIGRLAWEYEMTLYRIVQEALTNIHRHSGSRSAQIALARENGSITLIIRDEGHGMPGGAWVNRAATNGHGFGVGIPGMRERLRLLGGRLEINSNSGGTTLTAMVPLQS